MANEYTAKTCPFSSNPCLTKCALYLNNQEGGGDCSFAVMAMSVNAQTAMAAQAAQAQQQAISQAFMRQVNQGQGNSPIVL